MITTRSTAIALALAMSATAGVASANDGTIEFTGKITSTTCKVEGDAPGQGSTNIAVDLGSVSAANLATAGSVSGAKAFNIVIGGSGDTGCKDGETAHVRFDPTSPAIDPTTGRLKLDDSAATAKNVQIEITNADGTPINLYTDASTGVVIKNNEAIIPLIGRFHSAGAAEAGDANTRVAFEVSYD